MMDFRTFVSEGYGHVTIKGDMYCGKTLSGKKWKTPSAGTEASSFTADHVAKHNDHLDRQEAAEAADKARYWMSGGKGNIGKKYLYRN